MSMSINHETAPRKTIPESRLGAVQGAGQMLRTRHLNRRIGAYDGSRMLIQNQDPKQQTDPILTGQ